MVATHRNGATARDKYVWAAKDELKACKSIGLE